MAIARQALRTAVLLVNLGTPDAPTASAVKPYLKQFLSDPRVVEIPKLIWWCILNLIILPIRSGASAKKYASIWLKKIKISAIACNMKPTPMVKIGRAHV